MLLIIDGLDELRPEGKHHFTEALHRMQGWLPDWLRLLITCRCGNPALTALGLYMPIELDPQMQEHKTAVAAFLRERLVGKAPGMQIDEDEIHEFVKEKQPSFRYARRLI